MSRTDTARAQITSINDEMRSAGPQDTTAHRWVLTSGILALGDEFVPKVIERVRSFDSFDESNDPWGEHDFGSLEIAGERVLWKIDYYNLTLDGGSLDPANPNVTVRVLTVMLALEY